MGQLEGKSAIVTGGGTGLGAACARCLSREGAVVTLVGRRRERLEETAHGIRHAGGTAIVLAGDVARAATAGAAVATATDAGGGVDILVNNAGIHAHANLVHEIPLKEWNEFLSIDLTGPFLFTRAAVPSMIERGGGSILNVSSMTALVGLKGSAAYSAAKGGLISLTRTTAIDYAEHGIRANCLCPGGMEPADRHDMTAEDMAHMVEATGEAGGAPLARIAHVDEVAEFVLTVVGPNGASLTGAVIPFDGGYTAR